MEVSVSKSEVEISYPFETTLHGCKGFYLNIYTAGSEATISASNYINVFEGVEVYKKSIPKEDLVEFLENSLKMLKGEK